MVQRYKFESKSQLSNNVCSWSSGCFQWFKDTNLKVNHNVDGDVNKALKLFPMVQRYKFESKSQQYGDVATIDMVVSNGSKIQI